MEQQQILLQVVVLYMEHVVQLEQVMNWHHRDRVHIAVACQKSAEVLVLRLNFVPVVELDHIEVFLGVEKLVLVVTQERAVPFTIAVPLVAEVMAQEDHTGFERFIVD